MKKETYISIVVVIILLVGLGYFIFSDFRSSDGTSNGQNNSTTTPDGVAVEPFFPDIPAPSLDREFAVPDEFSEDIEKETMEQYSALIVAVTEDPTLRNEWLQLALLRNAIKDYVGAEEIWIYITQLYPLDSVAYGNLGFLYMNNLVDYEKANINLQSAVEKNPTLTQNAQNLYDLHRFRLEDPDTAVDLLEQASKIVPKEIFYPLRIAEHYRDTGNPSEAKKFFKKTLSLAEELVMTDIANYAREELDKL